MTSKAEDGELPDVWVGWDYEGCWARIVADCGGERYVPASRLEASEARCRELHEALRDHVIAVRLPAGVWGCDECDKTWSGKGECHAPGCLARERSATEPSDSGSEGQIDQ